MVSLNSEGKRSDALRLISERIMPIFAEGGRFCNSLRRGRSRAPKRPPVRTSGTSRGSQVSESPSKVSQMVIRTNFLRIFVSLFANVEGSADGTQLLVAAGDRVLMYDAATGTLLHSLKSHQDTVYAVEWASNGKRFASGGADKTVFIWNATPKGILRFTHNDSIQTLAYNPVTHQLASCTASDFGLWHEEQNSVDKIHVPSKILSACWTPDGQFLALGMESGMISIRDREGQEVRSIRRRSPIWTLCWNPSVEAAFLVLAVGCWDGTLSFYQLNGQQQGEDKELGYDPCSVSFFPGGEYLAIGGSNREVHLLTKDGVHLGSLMRGGDWVWAAKPRPSSQFYMALGCADGTVALHQLTFATVHGLYQDRYAFRDLMTDVIVQHLVTEQRVRIKCRALVRKIAVYRNRLAVQLPDSVNIYELRDSDNPYDLSYRPKQRIRQQLDCNLLVVTSSHVVLCQEKKLQLYTFEGRKEREWVFEAVIRYIKVVGGPEGGEGLLVGLRNGHVLEVFVSNPFPLTLVHHGSSVRCLDLSMSRQKLAVVDEHTNVQVYDVQTKDVLWTAEGANSVAWNTGHEEMLCYSGQDQLHIKTGSFPVAVQPMPGFVVGFHRSMIFMLHFVAMRTVDVPQSSAMMRYMDARDWSNAYKVACLGVTDSDWRQLGLGALKAGRLDIARHAFVRVRDTRYIELVHALEDGRKHGQIADSEIVGEALAYEGKFTEAARLFQRAGKPQRAVDMYADLRMWESARKLAETLPDMDVRDLMLAQARACEAQGDLAAAASIYKSIGNVHRALELYRDEGRLGEIRAVITETDASDAAGQDLLREAATMCRRMGGSAALEAAREAYAKLGEREEVAQVLADLRQWDAAIDLVERARRAAKGGDEDTTATVDRLAAKVFLPYGDYLASESRFHDAHRAYEKAGRPDLSAYLLRDLTHNALVEERFIDAARLLWQLAETEVARTLSSEGESGASVASLTASRAFSQIRRRGDMYYVFARIHEFVHAPFAPTPPDALLHAASALLSALGARRGDAPGGIGRVPHQKRPLRRESETGRKQTAGSREASPTPRGNEEDGEASAARQSAATSSRRRGATGQAAEASLDDLIAEAEAFATEDADSKEAERGGDGGAQASSEVPAEIPFKLSVTDVLYTLGKTAVALEASKVARLALDRLAARRLPDAWRDGVDLAALSVQAQSHQDKEELLPTCPRCMTRNPLVQSREAGDVCVHCKAPFIRSAISFEVLPLVEFRPERGVSHAAAEECMRKAERGFVADAASRERGAATETLSFGPNEQGSASGDGFKQALEDSDRVLAPGPVRVPEALLCRIPWRDVLIVRLHGTLPPRYFKNVIPEVAISLCPKCHHFFHQEDFEAEVLREGCPCCGADVHEAGFAGMDQEHEHV